MHRAAHAAVSTGEFCCLSLCPLLCRRDNTTKNQHPSGVDKRHFRQNVEIQMTAAAPVELNTTGHFAISAASRDWTKPLVNARSSHIASTANTGVDCIPEGAVMDPLERIVNGRRRRKLACNFATFSVTCPDSTSLFVPFVSYFINNCELLAILTRQFIAVSTVWLQTERNTYTSTN